MEERKSNYYGFRFKRPDELNASAGRSFAMPDGDGGASYAAAGFYASHYDVYGHITTQKSWITKYRETAMNPDVDAAIDDIVNEAIVTDTEDQPVTINLEDWPKAINDKVRNEVVKSFEEVLRLLDFKNEGYQIYRHWYVDGRLFFHVILDEKKPDRGIKELRWVDPTKITKITENKQEVDRKSGVVEYTDSKTRYVYVDRGAINTQIEVHEDSIVYVHSGIYNESGNMVISHLHKAIKPANQLKLIEDALVIYRMSRAPERRIFYIDVGNLPAKKAEEYVQGLMLRYKNKINYDANTGEIRDQRNFLNLQEDFWLPRNGSKSTEISTLDGGQNLGELDDVQYFRRGLYKSLNVPLTRLEPEAGFSLGRASEISRDEVKFGKFIGRTRKAFNKLFLEALGRHIILKKIMTLKEWENVKSLVKFDYDKDSHFTELKNLEVLTERLGLLNQMEGVAGKYVSNDWIRRNILQQTDEDIREEDKKIEDEKGNEQFAPDESDGRNF